MKGRWLKARGVLMTNLRDKYNHKYLKENRRNLRNNLTSAEATLWKFLKNKQLSGRRFRRQFSVENYILDFYCPSEKLAIELDGAAHFSHVGFEKDRKRDQKLHELGIKVLRFENVEVFKALEVTLETIRKNFKE